MKRIIVILLLAGIGILALAALSGRYHYFQARSDSPRRLSNPTPDVRIALTDGTEPFTIQIAGAFNMTDPTTGRVLLRGLTFARASVSLSEDNAIRINSARFEHHGRLDLMSLSSQEIIVNGAPVGYTLRIVVSQKRCYPVAVMPIEQYLPGVLSGEVPVATWHMEMLKAQAVVSRTYVAWRIQTRADTFYDVRATDMDQVFRTEARTNVRALKAVNDTRGQVMTYAGKLFPAFFHSCCGGKTESSTRVFSGDFYLPLTGRPCGKGTASSLFRWKRTLSLKQIESALKGVMPQTGKPVRRLYGVYPIFYPGETFPARPVAFECIHKDGISQFSSNAFRLAVGPGPDTLPSVYLDSWDLDHGKIIVAGRGFGHGVGMCQFGAQALASEGASYEEILKYFYFRETLTPLNQALHPTH